MVKSKLKYIQSLSQKKQRDADGVFVAEGPKIINDLLSSGLVEPLQLFALKEWQMPVGNSYLFDASLLEEIDENILSRISSLSTPNLVVGIFKKPAQPDLDLKGKLSLMADNIQDPGNMGSIIRCADWFGISQVICSPECTDVYGPKTVQSTMGSIARVHVYYRDLKIVLSGNKSISAYAATLDGKNLFQMDALQEGVIIIGNESNGISRKFWICTFKKSPLLKKEMQSP